LAHTFEPASSGRSKCRGCGQPLERGALRFGERLPNSYGEGEMTLWFHPECAAYKRPEPLLQALHAGGGDATPAARSLERIAQHSLQHPRLTRIDGAERAPGGQAKCRHCRESIERGAWRIRIVHHDEGGGFNPGGFIHIACSTAYFDTAAPVEQILHFSHDLSADERAALEQELQAVPKHSA
jgi:hypothetical protein